MSSSTFTVHTSLLFDPTTKTFLKDTSLEINPSTGLITKIYKYDPNNSGNNAISEADIDLRGSSTTVLPGLVDAHTHIFLHAYSETPALNQARDESHVERIVRATNHLRSALKAGYTTGAWKRGYWAERRGQSGLCAGPRLFVATEALASSGGYETRMESAFGFGGGDGVGISVPRMSDPCDGVDGVTAAVRRRIGVGADVVKVYADYRRRALRFPGTSGWKGCLPIQFPPLSDSSLSGNRNPNSSLFNQAEMDAIVSEAKRAKAPVAAHASEPEAVIMAAKAGVTSVEHGFVPDKEALEVMKAHGTVFVPTLAVLEVFKDELGNGYFEEVLEHTRKAWEMGVRLACGGDTGAFSHGDNAREMELMVEAGVPIVDVLEAATVGGWGGLWR